MCGISGVVALDADARGHQDAAHAALEQIAHRGPDGGGVDTLDLGWARATLGQVRLAVVDQSRVAVPYSFPYLGVVLAYNGEVYNWGELRRDLSDGTPWLTKCDAEVLARAWRRWGPKALDRLNGMFAFCLVDAEECRVWLARDRAGEKPLYWVLRGDRLYFASEVKGLACGPLREVPCPDLDALEFDCRESTPFEDVEALLPGHLLEASLDDGSLTVEDTAWWWPPEDVDEGMTWDAACAQTEALVVSAVRLRAEAEVPVAAYVSGGLDSAVIQAVAKVEKTYVYDAGFDFDTRRHSPWIEQAWAAAGCWPRVEGGGRAGGRSLGVVFTQAQAEEAMPQVAWHLDTPATWSALAHWFLAGVAKSDGAKVVLTGEGADELFHGYSRYRALFWVDRMRGDPCLASYQPLVEHLLRADAERLLGRLLDRTHLGHCPDDLVAPRVRALVQQLAPVRSSATLVERAARVDWHTTMQALLRMADRMTMAHGIENRAPFLDHRLVELAFRMPARWKTNGKAGKAVLREVARRLGVPRSITDATDKQGLYVPWNRWHPTNGRRGAFDRSCFAREMRRQWRAAFRARGHEMKEDDA